MTKDYKFRWTYACGHKTKFASHNIVTTSPENIIDKEVHCEKCGDFRRVVELTMTIKPCSSRTRIKK